MRSHPLAERSAIVREQREDATTILRRASAFEQTPRFQSVDKPRDVRHCQNCVGPRVLRVTRGVRPLGLREKPVDAAGSKAYVVTVGDARRRASEL